LLALSNWNLSRWRTVASNVRLVKTIETAYVIRALPHTGFRALANARKNAAQ